ncbi:MAG: hypothetical protein QMD11_13070 [Smithella sp.]|nr:hypothetical protein [Smithella sp.]
MKNFFRFKNQFLKSLQEGEKTVTLRPWKKSFLKLLPEDNLIFAVGNYRNPTLINAKLIMIEKFPVSDFLPERIISADCCSVNEIFSYIKSKNVPYFAAIWFRVFSSKR